MPALVRRASSVSYERLAMCNSRFSSERKIRKNRYRKNQGLLNQHSPPTCLRRGVWWFYNAVLTCEARSPVRSVALPMLSIACVG